jgi:hypothetical protein
LPGQLQVAQPARGAAAFIDDGGRVKGTPNKFTIGRLEAAIAAEHPECPSATPCRCHDHGRPRPDDVTVYLVVNDFGKFGPAFVETDIAEADRETVIRNFLSAQYSNALRVIAFNTAEGWSRDVSEDIAGEVLERAFDADANLSAQRIPSCSSTGT